MKTIPRIDKHDDLFDKKFQKTCFRLILHKYIFLDFLKKVLIFFNFYLKKKIISDKIAYIFLTFKKFIPKIKTFIKL